MSSLLILAVSALAFMSQAATYNATFTWYGKGDERGSKDCSQELGACELRISSGYSAAVSQNLFGNTSAKSAQCGKCLKLTARTNPLTNVSLASPRKDVVVMINNLCAPTDSASRPNPLCAQPDLKTANAYGGTIDVNLCADTGARAAVLGNETGLAFGTAEEVDCSAYNVTATTVQGAAAGSAGNGTAGQSGRASASATATATSGAAGYGVDARAAVWVACLMLGLKLAWG